MNRLILTTSFVLALGCGAAFAQTAEPQQAPAQGSEAAPMHHGHHQRNPQRQAEMLSHKLNLTPDQTSRIEPILATRDQQMEVVHANAQLTPQDRHAQMRSINEQAQQGMAGILSPGQMDQLKEMHHHRMHQGQPGDGSAAPTA